MPQGSGGSPGRAAPPGTSFGDLLKAYRRALGLTQEQLAERAGYSTVYVSMLERGQRLPLDSTAAAFADALDLGPHERAALALSSRPDGREREGRSGAPLVGRARELGLIERHLQGEGPPILLMAGEPGIGKTRLLREAEVHAGRAGLRVLEGGCVRRGGAEPFAPVLQALQGHIRAQDEGRLRRDLAGCAWLVRMLPELAGGPIEPLPPWAVPPEQERRLMDDAVVRFLGNVAGPRGTLLLLDDLQWAATDALDLIRLLARSSSSIRVLGAYRESETGSHHPLSTLLADLAHAGLLGHLTLGPLSHREAHALLEGLMPEASEVDGALQERVLGRADGVPYFVVSCAQEMRAGTLTKGNGEGIPWDLAQSIRQRVSALPEPARNLLGRAAVAGRRVPLALLAATGREHEEELLEGLDAACQASLLEETDGAAYEFTHDVIREVIEADLGAARRTVLHRQIGEALERGGGTPQALAYHYARSTDDAKAMLYLERAGDAAAQQHASATAEGYYRELVDRLDGRGRTDDAARAREKLGQVLTTAARYEDALAILEGAVQEYRRAADLEGEARATAQVGRVYYLRGVPDQGIERLASLRRRLERTPPSHALGALSTALAPLLLAQGRYREQLEAAERAADVARLLADERMLAEAEVWRGCALNQLGRLDEGRRVLEDAVPLAEAAGDLTSLVHALNDMGFLHERAGEFARSAVYKRRALEVAERVGDPAAIANMTFRCGQNSWLAGDWQAAREYFERSVATARRIDASSILAYPLFGLGLLALAEGDGEAVTRSAQECLEIAGRAADRQVRQAGESLLAENDLQNGRPGEARARLQALARQDEGLDLHSALPVLAEACLVMGDLAGAHGLVEEGIGKAVSSHNRVELVDMLRVKALLLVARRQWDDATAVLEEALALARAMPYPFAVARLLYTTGLLHLQTGELKEAQGSLDEALDVFGRLGAIWHARRTDQLAHAASEGRATPHRAAARSM